MVENLVASLVVLLVDGKVASLVVMSVVGMVASRDEWKVAYENKKKKKGNYKWSAVSYES